MYFEKTDDGWEGWHEYVNHNGGGLYRMDFKLKPTTNPRVGSAMLTIEARHKDANDEYLVVPFEQCYYVSPEAAAEGADTIAMLAFRLVF